MKKYFKFIPIIIGILAFAYFYFYRYVYLNNRYFYEQKLNVKVIKVKNYENKSLQFYYSDKYCITTFDTKKDTLKIGDSISKNAMTSKFEVYRIKNGKYEILKIYE